MSTGPEGAAQRGPDVVGLLLAAGAGRRFGRPKALVPGWLPDRCAALSAGGCGRVVVVLGAAAEEARRLVPPGAETVVAADWADGLSASLGAGLAAVREGTAEAAVVALVDTPGLTPGAVARVIAAGRGDGRSAASPAEALVQATYSGTPGHPVLLGRAHWEALLTEGVGDQGARQYLARHAALRVPCEDVADGSDVDLPPAADDRDENGTSVWGFRDGG